MSMTLFILNIIINFKITAMGISLPRSTVDSVVKHYFNHVHVAR